MARLLREAPVSRLLRRGRFRYYMREYRSFFRGAVMHAKAARSTRSAVQRATFIGLLVSVPALAGAADTYPNRPLRIVAPYGAGGSYDIVSRTLAGKLAEQIGQQIVVDNRPGATGRIGMEIGVKSQPDGYTMIVIGSSQAIAPSVHVNVPYDLSRSIAPIMLHG